MGNKNSRTKDDELKVNEEYASLAAKFKPRIGEVEDIRLAAKIGRVMRDEELMLKHKGKNMESTYCAKVFQGKKSLISALNYYFKHL